VNGRRTLVLRKGRERSVANRHPWVFSGAIESERGPADAAFADLVDSTGELVASGFYSQHSQIRLRAISFGVTATEETIVQRVAAAVSKRAPLLDEKTTAVRLIHAEGDLLSGLIVDRYGDHLVVEITSAGLERLREVIVGALQQSVAPKSILFLNDLPARKIERITLENASVGESPEETVIAEHGLNFVASLARGQKTGFFLDQRTNRFLARSLAKGARVLNLFSYSGGFGINAAAGGAALVEEVDVSEAAIDLARRNHELNGSACELRLIIADAFSHVRGLNRAGAQYDLVVCDPPAFARSRSEVERAARGYKDVNLYAMRLVRSGGLLMTFSCSGHMSADLFQKIVFSAALDSGKEASILKRLTASEDHPVSVYCPEGEYLKGLLLRIG
jgi:23S rRNA (cytosine1962-C5)-methyltransferase